MLWFFFEVKKRKNAKEEMNNKSKDPTFFQIHIQLNSGPSSNSLPYLSSALSHNLTLASNVQLSASLVVANVSGWTNEKPPSPCFGLAPSPLSGGLQRELQTNAHYVTEASFIAVYVILNQNRVCRFANQLKVRIKMYSFAQLRF